MGLGGGAGRSSDPTRHRRRSCCPAALACWPPDLLNRDWLGLPGFAPRVGGAAVSGGLGGEVLTLGHPGLAAVAPDWRCWAPCTWGEGCEWLHVKTGPERPVVASVSNLQWDTVLVGAPCRAGLREVPGALRWQLGCRPRALCAAAGLGG